MRTYKTPIGELDSVTTILDSAMSSSYLIPWAVGLEREMCIERYEYWYSDELATYGKIDFRKLVEEKRDVHKTALKDAGDVGSLVHNMIQAWCEGLWENNDSVDYMTFLSFYFPNNAIQMLCAWFLFIKDNKVKIRSSELTVYHPKGYAGTLDAVGTIGDEKAVSIFDWKTSASIYTKAWIQTEAYRRAYMFMFKEEPVARVVVRLCKEENKLGTYESIIRPLEIGTEIRRFYDGRKKKYVDQFNKIESDHEMDWDTFLACKLIHDRVKIK